MTTLYKKEIRGKSVRYTPLKEYDESVISALPEGFHLICVKPGLRSTLQSIDPDYASLLAVGRSEALYAMVEAMKKSSELRPTKLLTNIQMDAYNKFIATMQDDKYYLHSESYFTIAEVGLNALISEAKQLKDNNA